MERPSRWGGTRPNPRRQDHKLQPEQVAGPLPESSGDQWSCRMTLMTGLPGIATPGAHQTEVCTGVTEWEGEEPRSDGDEARVAISRCRSSTLFCSSALMASSSLRFWCIGIWGQAGHSWVSGPLLGTVSNIAFQHTDAANCRLSSQPIWPVCLKSLSQPTWSPNQELGASAGPVEMLGCFCHLCSSASLYRFSENTSGLW